MKEILTEIDINASASKTWEILTDFKNFPQWNPFIRQIDGTPIVGTKLKIYLHTSGGKNRTYQPTVTKAESNHELRWYGKSLYRDFSMGNAFLQLTRLKQIMCTLYIKKSLQGFL